MRTISRRTFLGVTLAAATLSAPLIARGLTASVWALPLHVVTGLAALGALGALWVRRYRVARMAAAAQVSLILWGWALGQYPYLVPPTMTIAEAAAPTLTLTVVLWVLAGGALVLFPSLAYLFRIFKGQPGRKDPLDTSSAALWVTDFPPGNARQMCTHRRRHHTPAAR